MRPISFRRHASSLSRTKPTKPEGPFPSGRFMPAQGIVERLEARGATAAQEADARQAQAGKEGEGAGFRNCGGSEAGEKHVIP